MAVLNRNDLTERLKQRFGESENDDDISFMEDITDTFDSLNSDEKEQELNEITNKYKTLQKKYRDRFFTKSADEDEDDLLDTTPDPEPKRYKFEDLFKVKE